MITFNCSCGKDLQFSESEVGKSAQCPSCGQVMIIQEVQRTPGFPETFLGNLTIEHVPNFSLAEPPKPTQDSASISQDTIAGTAKIPPKTDILTAILAPPQAPDEMGRLGDYRILQILGHGGMGVVYLAEDPKLRRKVAIKAMLPHLAESISACQRFLREAQVAAGLEHDHIVPILHIGEDRGVPYIVMPLLKGETLSERLHGGDPLTVNLILKIGSQVADALAAAHAQGLLHRDIKPANIWLEAMVPGRGSANKALLETTVSGQPATNFRVKILDFGLARLAQTQECEPLTQSGAILGTPGYMAPEQAEGKAIDARADLFSLGCVLYRMATGRAAFEGNTMVDRLAAVARDTPAPPERLNPTLPEGLSVLIMQLLEKEPGARPASAQEVARRLLAFTLPTTLTQTTNLGELEKTMDLPEKKKSWGLFFGGQRRWVWIMIVLLLLGGGSLLFPQVFFRFWNKDATESENKVSQDTRIVMDKDGKPLAKPPEKKKDHPPSFMNSIGMEFVLIPKGKFFMGGGDGRVGDREVEITQNFYLGKYEVTQEEWVNVMKINTSFFSPRSGGSDKITDINPKELKRFPVENVTLNDCKQFASRLNELENSKEWMYTLPTEAQWEYGCRGGPSENKFNYGFNYYLDRPSNTLAPYQANFADGLQRTCKVGSYPPNRLGLYDMHGNVCEWCEDVEGQDIPVQVLRGGGWRNYAENCSAGFRNLSPPEKRHAGHGFRLARVSVGK